jgi:hypothetical protein
LSEEPSSGRASGSMSSLGHPVASRYPFQFRLPPRGNSISSSGALSHMSPTTHSRSIQSRISQGTQSTGNRESTDSHSPRPYTASSSDVASVSPSGFPMPPRHSQQLQGRGRQRSGSVPAFTPASPSPVVFPTTGRPRAQTSVETDMGSLSQPLSDGGLDLGHESADDQAASESSQEAAEREDLVGLLTPSRTSSPRTSLLHRGSTISQHRLHGSRSRSRSNSRSNSQSGSSSSRSRTDSIAVSVRSRAQSMMQNIGAASHSSLELVQTAIRSRANSSMARLEEDSPYSSDARTHSRSGSSSTNENYTFGHPLRIQWPAQEEQRLEEEASESSPHSLNPRPSPPPQLVLHGSRSNVSVGVPSSHHPSEATSMQPSEDTVQRLPTPVHQSSPETEYHSLAPTETEAIDIPVPIRGRDGDRDDPISSVTSTQPDISTAAPSFVTAPATVVGTTESSGGRTVSSWGDITHMVDRADSAWRPA